MKDPDHLRCCLVTDRSAAPGPLRGVLRGALEGGIRFLEVRDPGGSAREILRAAAEALEEARPFGATVVVNDRIDVALAAGAHGVHLARGSLGPRAARRILGRSAWIGASTHELHEAVRAEQEGADYVFFGPVYATPSKAGLLAPRGLDALEAACRAVSLPVVAIGGMDPTRAPRAFERGAAGVAVIRFVHAASDPRAAAARLVESAGGGGEGR